MKQWFAMLAAVAFLALPVMVSAGEDTPIPPEANWSATPELSAGSLKQVVSTEPLQASDMPRSMVGKPSRGTLALSDEDATYQQVNRTVHDD